VAYLREKPVWGLMVGQMFADPIGWFYAFRLPEYLVHSRGSDLKRVGETPWIPFLFSALGNWVGGQASGTLVGCLGTPIPARKIVMVSSAVLMVSGVPAFYAPSSTAALAWVSVVLFSYSSWASNILSLPAGLYAPEEVGQVTGWSGTAGAIGGMVFALVPGWRVRYFSFGPVFGLAAGMILWAAVAVSVLVPRERFGMVSGHLDDVAI
jgi:ACS family hexuronate transporter-like MFS transporter